MEALGVLASISKQLEKHQELEEKADQAEEDLYVVLGLALLTIITGTFLFNHFQSDWTGVDALYFR
jgi:hypothetical protein